MQTSTFTFDNEVGGVMLVETTIIPSLCAEFDPNGAYTIGYRFFSICIEDMSIARLDEDDVRAFYKTLKSRKDRISLYYIMKEAF